MVLRPSTKCEKSDVEMVGDWPTESDAWSRNSTCNEASMVGTAQPLLFSPYTEDEAETEGFEVEFEKVELQTNHEEGVV